MRGKICIDGKEQDVRDFVARGDGAAAPGGFRATPISGRDWGVIDLDETGDYKLFFQFVPVDAPLPNNAELFSTLTVTAGIAAVALLAFAVFGPYILAAVPLLGEWSFRSVMLILCGLFVFGGAYRL